MKIGNERKIQMKRQYRTIDDIMQDFKTDEQGRTLWNISDDTDVEKWVLFEDEDEDENNLEK